MDLFKSTSYPHWNRQHPPYCTLILQGFLVWSIFFSWENLWGDWLYYQYIYFWIRIRVSLNSNPYWYHRLNHCLFVRFIFIFWMLVFDLTLASDCNLFIYSRMFSYSFALVNPLIFSSLNRFNSNLKETYFLYLLYFIAWNSYLFNCLHESHMPTSFHSGKPWIFIHLYLRHKYFQQTSQIFNRPLQYFYFYFEHEVNSFNYLESSYWD
jgi:hypothetical protein